MCDSDALLATIGVISLNNDGFQQVVRVGVESPLVMGMSRVHLSISSLTFSHLHGVPASVSI